MRHPERGEGRDKSPPERDGTGKSEGARGVEKKGAEAK